MTEQVSPQARETKNGLQGVWPTAPMAMPKWQLGNNAMQANPPML